MFKSQLFDTNLQNPYYPDIIYSSRWHDPAYGGGSRVRIAMANIAVIVTGGKQYIVREGQELKIEKLDLEPGAAVSFDALLVSDEEGKNTQVGTPTVSGAKISASVLDNGRADKVSVIKYKPKSRYRRNVGHRQPFTQIRIEKIAA